MLNEDLTKTLKSADRVKVARVIADMLGVENAESMSPDTAINQGLRKIKNKRMTPEFVSTVKKMVQLAQEVGIKVDQSVIPAAVSEEVVSEDTVNKKSTYNAAKDILRFNDFAKLSKINQGEVPVNKFSKSGAYEETNPSDDDKTAPEEDETDTAENVPTQVGATMTHPANDQLRRRKVAYKLGEEGEPSLIGTSTSRQVLVPDLGQNEEITPVQSAAARQKLKQIEKSGVKKSQDLYNKLVRIANAHPVKEEVDLEEAVKLGSKVKIHAPGKDYHGEVGHVGEIRHGAYKGAPKTYTVDYGDRKSVQLGKERIKLHKEETELEEDIQSADYKVNPDTGRKYRARHIEFAASKMGASPSRPEEDGEERKRVKTEPIIKPVKENYEEDEHDGISTESDLDDMVKQIEDEEDILDVYDEDELVIVDQDTGEVVDEMKEEVEQLDEVLSRMERMRAKIRFARTASKRSRRLQIALRSRSSATKINARARRLAVKLMKQRLTKKPLAQMTVSDKERAEKIIQRRKALINRLAMKLAPRIRKIENARLSHSKVTK